MLTANNAVTNALPILYTFRRCPYAMRARMAIYAAQLQVNFVEVSLKNKPQSLLEASPKGTVPVLVTAQGKVIDESRDIMLWALQQADPLGWLLPQNSLVHMQQIVDSCDIEFKPLLDRYKYFERYPEHSQPEYRVRGEAFLQQLEARLERHHFLMDDSLRFADVAIFPFIRQFAGVDAHWFTTAPYPKLQRWLDYCVTSEVFVAIMKK